MKTATRLALIDVALLAIAANWAAPALATPAPQAQPLNVVMIVVDDIGVDQLGCYDVRYPPGEIEHPLPYNTRPRPCTPRIDDLASRGLRFSNAWASPLCTPTRSQIMTGKRVRYTGLGTVTNPTVPSNNGLQTGERTIADLFAHDGALGKWHLAGLNQTPGHPQAVGFETFRGVWFNLSAHPQDGPTYCDWEQFDSASQLTTSMSAYATAVTTDDAIERMGQLDTEGSPWLLYVAYNGSHSPNHLPGEGDPNDGGCYQLPPASDCTGGMEWLGVCELCTTEGIFEPDVCKTRAMTQAMDHEIGRLLDAIDLDNATDTAVILVSDNGTPKNATAVPFAPAHGKGSLYQGGINVPLVIWTPGMDAVGYDHECHQLACVTDLFATTADLAQIVYTPDPLQDGQHSLAQYLNLNEDYNLNDSTPRQFVVSESFPENFVPDANGNPPANWCTFKHDRAIRNATHKLIEFRTAGTVGRRLYRLYGAGLGTLPPQDPALVPDAYELEDLLAPGAQRDAQDDAALAELTAELDAEPPLPLCFEMTIHANTVIESELASTSWGQSTTCRVKPVRVRYASNATQSFKDRAFLDFDTSALVGMNILRVDLEAGVYNGANSGFTRVLAKRMTQPAASYGGMGWCAQLFGSIHTTPVYAIAGGWTVDLTSNRFTLGDTATADLQSQLAAPSPWFSVGLRLEFEEPVGADAIQLYDVAGAIPNRLFVRYTAP